MVESVGMMGDPDYRDKVADKMALATEMGSELILVTPADLLGLGRLLGRFIGEDFQDVELKK